LLLLLHELLDGVMLAVLTFQKAMKRFVVKAAALKADSVIWRRCILKLGGVNSLAGS